MELTREIYWNVGHGSATLVPMYLLAIVAIGLSVYGFLQRVKIYKMQNPLTDLIIVLHGWLRPLKRSCPSQLSPGLLTRAMAMPIFSGLSCSFS